MNCVVMEANMNTREIMNAALELANLENLPGDCEIIVEGENIKKIAIGIDMGIPELLVAKELKCDCVIGHHPAGNNSIEGIYKAIEMEIQRMINYGITRETAENIINRKIENEKRQMYTINYNRIDACSKLLSFPYVNIHTPADLITENYIQNHLAQKLENLSKAKLKDVLEALDEIEEYKNSISKPRIRVGNPLDEAGQIAVLMTVGSSCEFDVYNEYFKVGVKTIICMYLPEDIRRKLLNQNSCNIIEAGHMASDSIGLNVIIKKLEESNIECIRMSGVINC